MADTVILRGLMPTASMNELYGEAIRSESRKQTGRGTTNVSGATANRRTLTCGDSITVEITTRSDGCGIESVTWDGEGCSVMLASASMMSEHVSGGSLIEMRESVGRLRRIVTEKNTPVLTRRPYEAALGSVQLFPNRRRCAMLPWEALEAAAELTES
ncbi:nitrogen fixation NifU-like protein [Arthrobacter sp. GAS37]|uniref:iron-sulfur cluster assembly scaffold protein n=1 Tax=Arthrobacter sp. GAS37 TaxID=3156261 RepID=UPI003835FBA5